MLIKEVLVFTCYVNVPEDGAGIAWMLCIQFMGKGHTVLSFPLGDFRVGVCIYY